jgi:hypothetical protein
MKYILHKCDVCGNLGKFVDIPGWNKRKKLLGLAVIRARYICRTCQLAEEL